MKLWFTRPEFYEFYGELCCCCCCGGSFLVHILSISPWCCGGPVSVYVSTVSKTSKYGLRDLSFMILMLICVAVAVAGLAVVIERIVYLNTNLNTKQ